MGNPTPTLEDTNGTTVLRESAASTPSTSWQNWLFGKPLATAEAPHQTIGKLIGLAVFASDALSSTAYATQEMLVILIAAGTEAMAYSIPLSFAIVVLLAILTISYEQTIHVYPNGGGAYIVSRDNLGELPAQTAGATLLMDYILTVSVSISSGVAQIVSAYPELLPYRVGIALAMVALIMIINLRGVRESGTIFAFPTYFFLLMMSLTLSTGLFKYFTGGLSQVVNPPTDLLDGIAHPINLFLILKAFASGTTAATGVEAISNGIMAFKEPRSHNAGITLIWMTSILGSFLVGITFLSHQIGALPSEEETIISQLARTVYDGRGVLYLMTITATTIILVMAANTAYADFPRLSALHAADGFLPRQLTYLGHRLVFSHGIVLLSIVSSLLIVVFQANVTALIPLYAIGVFLSFALSQAGMARRWWRSGHLKPGEEYALHGMPLRYDKHWVIKMIINGLGSVTTFIVMIVFATTKFMDGAWIVVVLVPILVSVFFSIHHHYKSVAKHLTLEKYVMPPRVVRHRVIIPVGGVHRGTLTALRYARALSDDITAVHVSIDPAETKRIQQKWEKWGDGVRLAIVESPYRLLLEPLLKYIERIDDQAQPNEMITVVVPQFIPRRKIARLLHAQNANMLREALLNRKDIVIMEVPYQIEG